MMQIILVGLGAGAAAALLFASVVSGSIAAIFLFYLAPLPILIAALGWSHVAGLIAAASATAAIVALSGTFFVAVPVIAFGAWWLGYLALLARPATNGGGALEWYPAGRLVLWAAVIGTLIVAAAVAGSFLPDLVGVLAGAFAASLLMVFAMLGFAVLHAITRGMSSRALVLAAVYAAAVVLGWPVLAMSILGLAEAAFNIRGRVARRRGPPSLRT